MTWTSLAAGFAISLTFIVAIGAQNAFVLRQGLRREHVGPIVFFCAAADALLMAAGVAGLAGVLGRQPQLTWMLTAVGVVFLTGYGLRALWRAARPGALQAAAGGDGLSRAQALAQVAGFTLLNPHVYLDTVLLVGSVGAQQPGPAKASFVLGAVSASALWFSGLGYGARALAPLFARPRAWQVLDGLIGVTMLVLAALLLSQASALGSAGP